MSKKQNAFKYKSPTITKKDIVKKIAKKHRYTIADVNNIITMYCECIASELKKGKRIHIQPLGYMEHRIETERKRINPITKEEITIPPRAYPKMKWSTKIKNDVKNSINLNK